MLRAVLLLTLLVGQVTQAQSNWEPFETKPFDLMTELRNLPALEKPMFAWPLEKEFWQREDAQQVAKQLSRITHAMSFYLVWAKPEHINKLMAFDPEIIFIQFSPYNHVFDKKDDYIFTKADCEAVVPMHDQAYWQEYYRKLVAARQVIGGRAKVVMGFVHEMCGQDSNAGVKLQVFYDIFKYVFPEGTAFFYNANQVGTGPGAAIRKSYSPIPSGVSSDYLCVSLYRNPRSVENAARLAFTTEATDKKLIVSISLGGHYEDFSYTPRGKNRRSPDVTEPTSFGETYYYGWSLGAKKPKVFHRKFGNPGKIAAYWAWPPIMAKRVDPDGKSFVMFCKGTQGTRIERP